MIGFGHGGAGTVKQIVPERFEHAHDDQASDIAHHDVQPGHGLLGNLVLAVVVHHHVEDVSDHHDNAKTDVVGDGLVRNMPGG